MLSPGTQRFTSRPRRGKFRAVAARDAVAGFCEACKPPAFKARAEMDAVELGVFSDQRVAPGCCLQMEVVGLLMNSFDIESMKSFSFYRKISSKPHAWPYFSLNKIAPVQPAKGQGPPMKRTLIYDYVHKLKL